LKETIIIYKTTAQQVKQALAVLVLCT